MATFVHIADERDAASIRRNGLKLPRRVYAIRRHGIVGIFAMPVVQNFLVSHQWLRELKRRGHRLSVGVYFRVADDELVLAGHYGQAKLPLTAAAATAKLASEQTLGYEVLIPRAIKPKEIHAIRSLPQTLGWRYVPGSHVSGIFCGCSYCQSGRIKASRIRRRFENGIPLRRPV